LIKGNNLPDFRCRQTTEGLYIFFANPKSKNLKFPLEYGQSFSDKNEKCDIVISIEDFEIPVTLSFEPYQSILLKVDNSGNVSYEDISFIPETPLVIPRVKPDKERWEVK